MALPDFPVGRGGLLQRQVLGQRDQAQQLLRVFFHPGQVHPGEVGRGYSPRAHQRRQFGHPQKGQIFEVCRCLARRFRDGGLKSRRSLSGHAAGQPGVEREGRLRVERHVHLAQRLISGQRPVHARQHHVELGILEFQAEQLQRGDHLIFRDTHGRRRLLRLWWLRKPCPRGGEDANQLEPGSSVHKPIYDTAHRHRVLADECRILEEDLIDEETGEPRRHAIVSARDANQRESRRYFQQAAP